MLEFAAKDFVEASHRIGLVLGEVRRPSQSDPDVMGNLGILFSNCVALGLSVTVSQFHELLLELAKDCPESITLEGPPDKITKLEVRYGKLQIERTAHHVETIYNTLRAELGARKFKAIPADRDHYSDPGWLTDSILFAKFPDTVDEFQRAGRCFAYGENTACLFHLMRVVDFCLRQVCLSLGTTYDSRNWNGIAAVIKKKMEVEHKQKSEEWKKQEPFYAEVLTDIQAISRGHRNPVLHELEKKYDEREALYMLTVVEAFARHVAEKLA